MNEGLLSDPLAENRGTVTPDRLARLEDEHLRGTLVRLLDRVRKLASTPLVDADFPDAIETALCSHRTSGFARS